MKRRKWIFVLAPFAIVLFVWIGGEAVMHLWNWLLPMLFGWKALTFWQAVGLLALCRILFGGWGGHRGGGGGGPRWRMTPEQREKFRQGMAARCAGVEPAADAGKQPA